MGDDSIDLKRRVLDPVRVPTWHTTEMRMLSVNAVVCGIVEATYEIALNARSVVDEQVGDGSSIRNEVGSDVCALDLVLAIDIGASGPPSNSRVAYSTSESLAWNLGKGKNCSSPHTQHSELLKHCGNSSCPVEAGYVQLAFQWLKDPLKKSAKLKSKLFERGSYSFIAQHRRYPEYWGYQWFLACAASLFFLSLT